MRRGEVQPTDALLNPWHRALSRESRPDVLHRVIPPKKPNAFLKSASYVLLIFLTHKEKLQCIYHAIQLWQATDLRVSESCTYVDRA